MINQPQKTIIKLAIIFFGMMAGLTFFSKTLNNLGLPRVETAKPVGGSLVWEIFGEAKVEAETKSYLYTELNRQVKEVLVREGTPVKAGQLLAVMGSKVKAIEELLALNLSKVQNSSLSLTGLTNLLVRSNTTADERKLKLIKEKIPIMEGQILVEKKLFEKGATSKENISKAEQELLQVRIELAEKEAELEQKIQSTYEELKHVLLVAPIDGKVGEINYSDGILVDKEAKPVLTIVNNNKGFLVRKKVSAKQSEYFRVGDPATVVNKSGNELQGVIVQKRKLPTDTTKNSEEDPDEDKELVVKLGKSADLQDSDQVRISIVKRSRFYSNLVPNKAIAKNQKGEFVWVLREKSGLLGREYYVLENRVTVANNDDNKTAIINGLYPDTLVVTSSSKTLSNGDRVYWEKKVDDNEK